MLKFKSIKISLFTISLIMSMLFVNVSMNSVSATGSNTVCNAMEGCYGGAFCFGGKQYFNCEIECEESSIGCPTQKN